MLLVGPTVNEMISAIEAAIENAMMDCASLNLRPIAVAAAMANPSTTVLLTMRLGGRYQRAVA
jgi:hypothetical protein